MTRIKGITIDIDGNTSGLDKALNGVNSSARKLQTELRGVNSLLKVDPKNTTLLAQKQELLAQSVSKTAQKLKTLEDAQEQVNEQFKKGEISEENYRNFQRELVATKSKLEGLKKEQEEFLKSVRKTKTATERIGEFGAASLKAGQKIKGVSKAAAIAVGAMAGLAVKAGAVADDLNTLSTQTGLSTSDIQKFKYATELVDVPLKTLTGGLAKLTKSMGMAKGGTGAAAEAFDTLKVSIKNQDGSLRNNQDVLNDTFTALGKMGNATERDALAMDIFGKKAQDLNPLILGGADALKKYGEEAENMGIILDQKTIDKANEFNDVVDKMKATVALAGVAVGANLGGVLQPMLEKTSKAVVKVSTSLSKMNPNLLKVIVAITAMAAVSAPLLIAIGKIGIGIGALGQMLGGISKVMGALSFSPIILVTIAVTALISALGLVDTKSQNFKNAFDKIGDSITKVFAKIPKVLSEGLSALIQNLPKMIDIGLKLMLGLVSGLIQSIPVIVKNLPKIIKAIVGGLLKAIPLLAKAGLDLIKALWNGFKSWTGQIGINITNFAKSIPKKIKMGLGSLVTIGVSFIKTLWNGVKSWSGTLYSNILGFARSIPRKIKSGIGSLVSIGSNLVSGLWSGISNKFSWLISKIKGFTNGIKNKLKEFFDIHSPSKWADNVIGKNLVIGLADGITNNSKIATNAVKTFSTKIKDSLKNGMTTALNQATTATKKQFDKIKTTFDDSIKDIKDKMDGLATSLAGDSGLFDEEEEEPTIIDPSAIEANAIKAADKIRQFYLSIEQLKNKNLPKGLFNEMLELGPDGLGKINSFLAMTETQMANVVNAYNQKIKTATDISKFIYADDIKIVEDKAIKSYATVGASAGKSIKNALDKSSKVSGEDAKKMADNLTNGLLTSMMNNIKTAVAAMKAELQSVSSGSSSVQKQNQNVASKKSSGGVSVVQNININQPVKTPLETSRALKNAVRYGVV